MNTTKAKALLNKVLTRLKEFICNLKGKITDTSFIKAKEILLSTVAFLLLIAAIFLISDLGNYHRYQRMYEQGKLNIEYDSFWEFLEDWNGDYE